MSINEANKTKKEVICCDTLTNRKFLVNSDKMSEFTDKLIQMFGDPVEPLTLESFYENWPIKFEDDRIEEAKKEADRKALEGFTITCEERTLTSGNQPVNFLWYDITPTIPE